MTSATTAVMASPVTFRQAQAVVYPRASGLAHQIAPPVAFPGAPIASRVAFLDRATRNSHPPVGPRHRRPPSSPNTTPQPGRSVSVP